jgi:AraC-like DNA-binding protein
MVGSNVAAMRGVDCFWRSERDGEPTLERVLPTGRAQVVVDLDTGAATLVGPRTVSAIVRPPRCAVGLSLSGSGLARIVGGDAHQLVDAAIDLEVLGWDSTLALELGCEPTLHTFADRLLARFEVDERIVAAEQLLRAGASSSSIAAQLGFDRRKFVPMFHSLVGVAPKHYEILRRMQGANAALRSRVDLSLARIAADLGFSDESHMARDVRRLTGHTPNEIRRLAPGPANHIPVSA